MDTRVDRVCKTLPFIALTQNPWASLSRSASSLASSKASLHEPRAAFRGAEYWQVWRALERERERALRSWVKARHAEKEVERRVARA
jgi:hypothetical protein